MADGVLDWAKRQRGHWETEMKNLASGRKLTFDVKADGSRVDTTADTLADLSTRAADLDVLILKHGAANR